MGVRVAAAGLALLALAVGVVYAIGRGWLGEQRGPGVVTSTPIPPEVVRERSAAQADAAGRIGVATPRPILFGDLHVHTTYSIDAFAGSMPLVQGQGAHPPADACDFARHCAALDFWAITDHATALTPASWDETVESIRRCNAVAGDPDHPDVVAFLGWEWSQVGATPQTHYGHRNVILRRFEEERTPRRPIRAPLAGGDRLRPSWLALGLLPFRAGSPAYLDLATFLQERAAVPPCPAGVGVRELPDSCAEQAATPAELFAKLDDWGLDALVIPHGTSLGLYTPAGASWEKQLDPAQHDPQRQRLIEVFSGHGSSEEFRPWREVTIDAHDNAFCPPPRADFLPSCWRAGELIRDRCEAAGESKETCDGRAEEARQRYLRAGIAGHHTVPGATLEDWQDAGQCRDCFLPAFNYRPRSSVQHLLALSGPDAGGSPLRFRFGFIASSDVHSARPGTGYKEYDRAEMTEARFGALAGGVGGLPKRQSEPAPRSVPFEIEGSGLDSFALRESERAASFSYTGGLVAVHAAGRDRDAIWGALERREVYGTSGPRILLWFDLVNPPEGGPLPMGAESAMAADPSFEVRAVGSFEQRPGCPESAREALASDRLEYLCRGECYHPSDRRRRISRIEVIRIRPQQSADEEIAGLIEDPWRVYPCEPDPTGCRVRFTDGEFATSGRDAVYYVRAVEEPSPAVNAGGLRCTRGADGRCERLDACLDVPYDDDCLAENEERAWSSPIFVDYADGGASAP